MRSAHELAPWRTGSKRGGGGLKERGAGRTTRLPGRPRGVLASGALLLLPCHKAPASLAPGAMWRAAHQGGGEQIVRKRTRCPRGRAARIGKDGARPPIRGAVPRLAASRARCAPGSRARTRKRPRPENGRPCGTPPSRGGRVDMWGKLGTRRALAPSPMPGARCGPAHGARRLGPRLRGACGVSWCRRLPSPVPRGSTGEELLRRTRRRGRSRDEVRCDLCLLCRGSRALTSSSRRRSRCPCRPRG